MSAPVHRGGRDDRSKIGQRARRRRATQRRRLARVDVAIGIVGAGVILLATPGLAIAAVIALIVLLLCGVSVLVERRLARRRRRSELAEEDDQ